MADPVSFINGKWINEPTEKDQIYFPEFIYGLKTTDPVYGGPWVPETDASGQTNEDSSEGGQGISNRQAYELGLRTLWLRLETGHTFDKLEEIYNNLNENLNYTAFYLGSLFQDLYANRIQNIKVISTLKSSGDPSIYGPTGNVTPPNIIQEYIPMADEDPPPIKDPIMPEDKLPNGDYPDGWVERDVTTSLYPNDFFLQPIVVFKDSSNI
jgi:hypothetical protein